MLAVDSFASGMIMESISEQDLVEHCVIVQPSPSSIEHSDPPPPPPTTTTTTTRIVYHHSARLGGQLVTVLTHAPPQQQRHIIEDQGSSPQDNHGQNHTHSGGVVEEDPQQQQQHRLVVVMPGQGGQHATTLLPLHRLHSLHLKPVVDPHHHHPTVLVHTSPHTDAHSQQLSHSSQDNTLQAEDLSTSTPTTTITATPTKSQQLSLATLTVIVPPPHNKCPEEEEPEEDEHHQHQHQQQHQQQQQGQEDHQHQHQEQEEEEEEEATSVDSMICDGEFRMNHHHNHTHHQGMDHSAHHHHHHHQVIYPNGRLSPSDYSPSNGGGGGGAHNNNNSAQGHYATLTPLQPLPPISTMTDKFTYAPQSFMQHNGVMGGIYGAGNYEGVKLMSPQGHHYSSPNNGMSPPPQQHGGYQQGGNSSNGMSPKMSPGSYDGGGGSFGSRGRSDEEPASPHHVNVTFTALSSTNANNGLSPHEEEHSSPPLTAVVIAHRDANSPSLHTHPHITKGGLTMVTTTTTTPAGSGGSTASSSAGSTGSGGGGGGSELEEINTKELAARISAELKRYSIPQAIFAQRVLCRSQGTLSDLLRNPKPWSKLKSGRETFRRMWKWLQEPEFQRMSALRLAGKQSSSSSCGYTGTAGSGCGLMGPPGASPASSFVQEHPFDVDQSSSSSYYQSTSASSTSTSGAQTQRPAAPSINTTTHACKRKEEQQTPPEQQQQQQQHPTSTPKKPRLVFTDLQRRTLQAIFKETKRPSKEMQVTIARQLGLEPTTVGNFFMNARRRSMDKWKEENEPSPKGSGGQNGNGVHNVSADEHEDAL